MTNKHRMFSIASVAMLAMAVVTILRAAPATPKGYLIAEITVTDPDTFKQYAAASTTVMTQFGGKYLVRGGQTVVEEGSPPGDRFVVIEFESLAAARAFYDSAAYQAVVPMRMKSAHSRVFLVEGPPPL
jgi:uncharacterized protein (DUF1330 family)